MFGEKISLYRSLISECATDFVLRAIPESEIRPYQPYIGLFQLPENVSVVYFGMSESGIDFSDATREGGHV